ncbi:hypothetical protein J6590_071977 [Homalodisca vitripennis]|nr:hypothetical protein J6590_091383 [Homalodisca vitripennis]KAG8310005.1 hypothetical protein J6590_071977 [Homalodisca vitripennis]
MDGWIRSVDLARRSAQGRSDYGKNSLLLPPGAEYLKGPQECSTGHSKVHYSGERRFNLALQSLQERHSHWNAGAHEVRYAKQQLGWTEEKRKPLSLHGASGLSGEKHLSVSPLCNDRVDYCFRHDQSSEKSLEGPQFRYRTCPSLKSKILSAVFQRDRSGTRHRGQGRGVTAAIARRCGYQTGHDETPTTVTAARVPSTRMSWRAAIMRRGNNRCGFLFLLSR